MLPPMLHLDIEKLQGKFIALEGPDGFGKSTLAAHLAKALRDYGLDVHETRSPYGNSPQVEPFGQLTRFKEQTILARWLVHAAAHAQHYEYEILPALKAGKTVICDRFWWSAMAYNLQGDGLVWTLDENVVYAVELLACQGRFPDLVITLGGRSFRPEFEDRQGFNQRVCDTYEGMISTWHRPVVSIQNCEPDDPDDKAMYGEEAGLLMLTDGELRNKTESEMVMEALQGICATFCPLPKDEVEAAAETEEEDEDDEE